MQAMLTVIVTWLSISLGLPATYDHPRVETVPHATLVALRYGQSSSDPASKSAVAANGAIPNAQDLVAVYDTPRRTIYLAEGWSGKTPAEVSVLVHEMVHHLQNLSGSKYECMQEREALAYKAQDMWLRLFGEDLEKTFEINPMALLVRTRCFY